MSAHEVQRPKYRLYCDSDGCLAMFETESYFLSRSAQGVRSDAGEAGWDVPPPSGKGSRRETDYCPEHARGPQ